VAAAKWPKTFPPLSAEQERIRDDFMQAWHVELPQKYGIIERFNHGYPLRNAPADFVRTLEIGAGLGEHLRYERLTDEQRRNYVAVELRPEMAAEISRAHPGIQVVVGDCQERLEFPDGWFDRVLAVHVLEHLPNLPAAVREIHRLLDKQRGQLEVVIPCEGGVAYSLARRISAQRFFERRYKQSYRWLIEREHINRPHEIIEELGAYFTTQYRSFFPLRIPSVTLNLVVGLTLRPRRDPA
jgi:SAM-dependent methyltransferase